MLEVSPILIPILALSIPLVAVVGRVIIQPIVSAISELARSQQAPQLDDRSAERIARLEAQLQEMDHAMARLVEDYEFRRELQQPRAESATALQPPD
ncbi:MAG TPA: hypothetical protein VFI96_07805 [Longimicrobiaceae bacterium]|nr:hypothetical protein [Longimicrobiaceae bacterium]